VRADQMRGLTQRATEFFDSATLFLAWWGCWSLLDAYALRFTPVSQSVVLACCVLARLAPAVYQWVQSQCNRGSEATKRIMQGV
jgi:hypothetical protein